MTTLRRILITSVAAAGISGVATANTIVGYQSTINTTSTDIVNDTNLTNVLPGFDPGSTNTFASNVAGGPYTTGISMSSLNPALFNYTLVGFNVVVKETLTGSYTITNSSTNSNATGSAFVDSYTAVSLGNPLAPPLTNNTDSLNDLYNCAATDVGQVMRGCASQGEQVTSNGGGPDPNAPNQSGLNIAANGGTFTSPVINVNSGWVDFGCEVTNSVFCSEALANAGASNELAAATLSAAIKSAISGANLAAFFSTATETDTALTGGDSTTTYNTMVKEQIAVTYDYTATSISSTPEPTTMALFGGALLGLGLIGKRFKKS